MMRPTNSGFKREDRRLRGTPIASRRRVLMVAVALSIAAHVVAALLAVYVPRGLQREARPQEQGTVELLMVERKGAEPSKAGPSADVTSPEAVNPTPPPPKQVTEAPKPEPQQPEAQQPEMPAAAPHPAPAPPVTASSDQAAPPPMGQRPAEEAKADTKPDARPPMVQPTPPKAGDALTFDLAGTESESNAEVLGGHVVPASPDNRFRNRPPVYPYEAAIHGEHGSVLLLIHVSNDGLAAGVDVLESSGVSSLDTAATVAVRKWRFRPALREGRAIPFDMPFRFVFEAD